MGYRCAEYRWRATSAARGASRYDDIHFHDERLGWAINADGLVPRTDDGGDIWSEQTSLPHCLRCIGFADRERGWLGTFAPRARLHHTVDGGKRWAPVEGLPAAGPDFICGLCVVDAEVVYAAGTNRQTAPVGILKTVDGGATWSAIDTSPWAASLVDVLFVDRLAGWVVGGRDNVRHPERPAVRGDLIPTVLHMTDGGVSWTNTTEAIEHTFPQGEWGWKIQRVSTSTFVVTTQNYRDGAMLRSGGLSWQRLRINDRQRNSNLEGVGFLDETRGWVGGWGDLSYAGGFTSETTDQGENWQEANHVGFRLNRFRPIGDPVRVIYASGDTVYNFTDEPARPRRVEVGLRAVEASDIAPLPWTCPSRARRWAS